MKNILIRMAAGLALILALGQMAFVDQQKSAGSDGRDSQGTLDFSVRTVTYNGDFAPKNAGAIWITNAQNQFVKTLKVWASHYRYTLVRWNASSGGNTSGAITGASLNNHILHNVAWNGSPALGTQVPDGEYKINVEFTEHNATAANLGKYKQAAFVKSSEPVNTAIPNETYFRDMTLAWTPVNPEGTIFGRVTDLSGNPIPGGAVAAGPYSAVTGLDGTYSLAVPAGTWDAICTAGGYVSQTAQGVVVGPGEDVERNFALGSVANSDEYIPSMELRVLFLGPNPFRERLLISYTADPKQPARLEMFDLRGRLVEQRWLNPARSGNGEFVWDGRDARGRPCPSGSYLLKLSQGERVITRRLILLR